MIPSQSAGAPRACSAPASAKVRFRAVRGPFLGWTLRVRTGRVDQFAKPSANGRYVRERGRRMFVSERSLVGLASCDVVILRCRV